MRRILSAVAIAGCAAGLFATMPATADSSCPDAKGGNGPAVFVETIHTYDSNSDGARACVTDWQSSVNPGCHIPGYGSCLKSPGGAVETSTPFSDRKFVVVDGSSRSGGTTNPGPSQGYVGVDNGDGGNPQVVGCMSGDYSHSGGNNVIVSGSTFGDPNNGCADPGIAP